MRATASNRYARVCPRLTSTGIKCRPDRHHAAQTCKPHFIREHQLGRGTAIRKHSENNLVVSDSERGKRYHARTIGMCEKVLNTKTSRHFAENTAARDSCNRCRQ
jgi:hypothetical protein